LASLQAILVKHNAPGKDLGLMPVLLRGAYAVATIDRTTGDVIAMDLPAVQ